MLDAKISLVPTHQLVVPSTFLALATDIRTYKATKIHKLKSLTYELFFQNSSTKPTVKGWKHSVMVHHFVNILTYMYGVPCLLDQKSYTFSDFVTKSYGESWDSSWEES